MKRFIATGMMIAAFAVFVPSAAFAAVYEYVDNTGGLKQVEAANTTEAQAKAVNMNPRSGFVLVSNAGAVTETLTDDDQDTLTSEEVRALVASLQARLVQLREQLRELLASESNSNDTVSDPVFGAPEPIDFNTEVTWSQSDKDSNGDKADTKGRVALTLKVKGDWDKATVRLYTPEEAGYNGESAIVGGPTAQKNGKGLTFELNNMPTGEYRYVVTAFVGGESEVKEGTFTVE